MIFYTGSYTQEGAPAPNPIGKGISAFYFDEKSGEFTHLLYTEQRNPSYLVVSNDGKFLYAVEEMYANLDPQIYAYEVGLNGALTYLNKQPINGDYACHLAICGNELIVGNYVSGNAIVYPIKKNGGILEAKQVIQHVGKGLNPERQEAPHVHMVQAVNEKQFYLVDLGLDTITAYEKQNMQWCAISESSFQIEAGAGARHMVLNQTKTIAYVLGELSGEVYVVDLTKVDKPTIQKKTILPPNNAEEFGSAAIRIHPNGNFLYTSCRGVNALTIFKISATSGELTLVAQHLFEEKTPRDFNIHPEGKWLLIAFQDTNVIKGFEIDETTGKLHEAKSVVANTTVNICWYNA